MGIWFTLADFLKRMTGLIGEFPSTLDDRGRFLLPTGLKKQLPAREQKVFVVNRGIEKHLTLFTKKEFDRVAARLEKKSIYVKKNRIFIRHFHNGATIVSIDGNGRLLLPKQLMEYAGIDKDIVVFAYNSRIEIWSQRGFDKMNKEAAEMDMSDIAEDVMGEDDDVS